LRLLRLLGGAETTAACGFRSLLRRCIPIVIIWQIGAFEISTCVVRRLCKNERCAKNQRGHKRNADKYALQLTPPCIIPPAVVRIFLLHTVYTIIAKE
jgi:hypothetical protein